MQFQLAEMGEKASSHVHTSLEWESQELQPRFTELKPREGRQVTQQGKDPASPLLGDLPSAAGCRLDPSEVIFLRVTGKEGHFWILGATW